MMALFGRKDEVTLRIGGMTCKNCQAHVEKALQDAPGVVLAKVDLLFHQATVTFDPAQGNQASLIAAVKAAGYEAEPKGESA